MLLQPVAQLGYQPDFKPAVHSAIPLLRNQSGKALHVRTDGADLQGLKLSKASYKKMLAVLLHFRSTALRKKPADSLENDSSSQKIPYTVTPLNKEAAPDEYRPKGYLR
jgi:hypothetical protein